VLGGQGAGCSPVSPGARIGIDAPSASEAQFGPVAGFLNNRCGSLDCHGQVGRNLRIWGCSGMRLAATDIPQCSRALGGTNTTADEVQATYRSLVGLEPAVMTAVFDGKGQQPQLLTFVQKARGEESHKGGALIVPGDPQDICITSWLSGMTDLTNCENASNYPIKPILDAGGP
jgi:hypothetical protein